MIWSKLCGGATLLLALFGICATQGFAFDEPTPYFNDKLPEHKSDSLVAVNDLQTSNPTNLTGHPITMSASVAAGCRGQETVGSCKELLPLISKMTGEPRDLAWAPAIEEKIVSLVKSDPGEFTVRTIECRQSLCIAEVASTQGQFHFAVGVAHDASLKKNLRPQTSLLGYEDDPAGSQTKVTVTFSMFIRR